MVHFHIEYGDQCCLEYSKIVDIEEAVNLEAELAARWFGWNPIKLKNEHIHRRMVRLCLMAFANCIEGDGVILAGEGPKKIYPKTLEYRIGAPFPQYAKFAPNGHNINEWSYPDLWRSTPREPGLINRLRGLTKYEWGKPNIRHTPGYILFTMQGLHSIYDYDGMGEDLVRHVCDWADQNKKHLVLRWHPTTDDKNIVPYDWWDNFDHYGYIDFDTHSRISDLIDGCSQLWTVTSCTGLEALMRGKPASVFGACDYASIAKRARTADEAFNPDPPDPDIVEQFLTWYVRKLCINVMTKTAPRRVEQRMRNHFERDIPIPEIYDVKA